MRRASANPVVTVVALRSVAVFSDRLFPVALGFLRLTLAAFRQKICKKQKTNQSASSAAVQVETGNFVTRQRSKHARNRACRKRSRKGIPVPDLGRE